MIVDCIFNYLNTKKDFPYVFVSPFLYAVGSCAEEIYFGLLKARREKKLLILIRPFYIPRIFKYQLCNSELFKLESPHFNYRNSWLWSFSFKLILLMIYGPLRIISLLKQKFLGKQLPFPYNFPRNGIDSLWMQNDRITQLDWSSVRNFQWKEQFEHGLSVSVSRQKRLNASVLRREMGIPDNAWFVCLHVREGGFRNDGERRAYRNSDISNYTLAIREITNQGGYVVRIGDSGMKKLPPMEKVIDYPFTKFKSELMDLYLISECRFYVGCQSGTYDVAVLFHKRILLANMYNWTFAYPLRKGDIGIIKHFYSKSKNRFLSVKELLTGPWDLQNTDGFVGEDYQIYDNTDEEIKDLVRECLLSEVNFKHSDLQIAANQLRVETSYKLFASDDLPSGQNLKDLPIGKQYRYASRIEDSSGTLSNEYLNKHFYENKMIKDKLR